MASAIRTIPAALAHWAAARGSAPALVGSSCVTFAGLLATISSFESELSSAGFNREDRIGLLVPPGISGAQLVIGLASSVTLVPLSPALTAPEIIQAAEEFCLKALVIPRWVDARARGALQGIALIEAILEPGNALSLHRIGAPARDPAKLRPARETDFALLLRSSGTTGVPKIVPFTHGGLVAVADKMGSPRWFGVGPHDRAACTLPLYHSAGLKTALFAPLVLGASVAFPSAGKVVDLSRWVDQLRPTYLSVAPAVLSAMLERLKASGRKEPFSSIRFVTCAASVLPDDLRLRAEAMLRVPVLDSYGLSEAGPMTANPVPPGRAKPGTVGISTPGHLRIVDEKTKQPVPAGTVGEIMISGPTLTPGYLASGDASPAGLSNGWLLTGDLGCLDEEGYLTLVGRSKEVINRGGEKVFPYEVEKAMLVHPAVHEAAAFGVPHPRLGESVAAVAVLKPDQQVSERELQEFLAIRLAGYKRPRTVSFVSGLPRGATGKVLRRALRDAHAGRRSFVEPDELLEVELSALWAQMLGTSDIGMDDDFLELGGDSLMATEMLLEVERLTGKAYPQSELTRLTIRRIADIVMADRPGVSTVLTEVKRGPGFPLFFCHGDHVGRGIYAHKLAALLPAEQPVFLLNDAAASLAGRGMEEIAASYLDAVLPLARNSPVFVGGWCNGGLAAWHLAHLLRAQGVEVVELLLIDTISLNARPGLARLAGLLPRVGRVMQPLPASFLRQKAMWIAWKIRTTRGARGFASLVQRAARKALRRAPGLSDKRPSAVDRLRLLTQSMSRYIPPPIDVGVTCFIARDEERFEADPGPWRHIAPRVSEVSIPGTHLGAVVSERQHLAAALGEVLGRANARYHVAQTRTPVHQQADLLPAAEAG